MTVAEIDRSTVPGAMEHELERVFDDGTKVEFESAPAGWLTKDGERRRSDWRAYHYSFPHDDCGGTGRLEGKTAKGVKCAKCKGTGTRRERFPSVTSLLDAITNKPGLPPWYERRGIEGAVEAIRRGLINPKDEMSLEMAVDIVRSNRLGADRARDTAAERGLNVHACLEHYMLTGEAPNPVDHPVEHWGYLQALTRFLVEWDPEPEAVEQLVVHPEERYAGRLDLRARHSTGELITWDAKTQENGSIYLGAHAQVNLYERAAIRCGDEPADRLMIVVFAENGEFRVMPADQTPEFTKAALDWYSQARPIDSACESLNRKEREARKDPIAA